MPEGKAALKALADQKATPRRVGVDQFRDQGATATGTAGQESEVVSFTVETPLQIRANDPFRVAIPAHETFAENGAADTETLSLSHDLVDSPVTESVVVYEGGSRVQPSSIDYGADTVDMSTSGNGNTIDVFYTAKNPGLLRIDKKAPKAAGRTEKSLYEAPIGLLNQRKQYEQPEYIEGDRGDKTDRLLPDDFTLSVYVDVPYSVELGELSRTNGTAKADNALVSFPVNQGDSPVSGLARFVAQQMVR